MPQWSLRHLVEAAIPGTDSPWGVTAERYEAVREIADRARVETQLTISRASDFCAALGIRFRQSLLPSGSADMCRDRGIVLYGSDVDEVERELLLFHGLAHRLLPARLRPVEFFTWLLVLELAVPRELLVSLGTARFVQHHPGLPLWMIEQVARMHGVRTQATADRDQTGDRMPDSTTSSKPHG
jgi:hypothetical protein